MVGKVDLNPAHSDPEATPAAPALSPVPKVLSTPSLAQPSGLPYKETVPARRRYFGKSRGDRKCQDLFLCSEPSHSGGCREQAGSVPETT